MKVAKIQHVFAKLHRIVFTKASLCLQINGKQNTIFFSKKMHDATLKLRQLKYNMLIAHTELLLQVIDE